jgi:hypothetical protein
VARILVSSVPARSHREQDAVASAADLVEPAVAS